MMEDSEIIKLRHFATIFRAAILKSNRGLLIKSLRNFPNGSCSDTSILLARFMIEKECGYFQRMFGEKIDGTHVWLSQNGIIVDITASQFGKNIDSVIVTRDHSWHNMFTVVEEKDSDIEYIRLSSPHIYAQLNSSYDEILSKL